jgi:hypothetical protein
MIHGLHGCGYSSAMVQGKMQKTALNSANKSIRQRGWVRVLYSLTAKSAKHIDKVKKSTS